ncbi:ubiE/COQ5 methyltransferase [Atractiella rhizophila]|nr:ubiE/COQ5 methyltransferase [Atractiella rhizophila]
MEIFVEERYSAIAQNTTDNQYAHSVASSFGYSSESLESLPEGANMGLSCGNPVTLANIQPGEIIVDLGSGAGIDAFLAADKVGSSGKVIGVDFSQHMIDRARQNASKRGYQSNIEFKHAPITNLPVDDNSVDCILSNCVINLVTDKTKLFPGGRISISDIVAKKLLPARMQEESAYVACLGGAIQVNEYRDLFVAAGFQDVKFIDTKADLNVFKPLVEDANITVVKKGGRCCGPINLGATNDEFAEEDFNNYLASFQIYAKK